MNEVEKNVTDKLYKINIEEFESSGSSFSYAIYNRMSEEGKNEASNLFEGIPIDISLANKLMKIISDICSQICLLLYQTPMGDNAKKRIETLRKTNDGFIIAEQDLLLRGSGEILGTRQSGFHIFKMANLNEDTDLLDMANKNAKEIVENNGLNENIRLLLQLFSKDEALKYLDAG